jgi:Flp pilus assembly pilin Flp
MKDMKGLKMSLLRISACFLKDESAATMSEFALIASLVALAIIISLSNLGTRLSIKFASASNNHG